MVPPNLPNVFVPIPSIPADAVFHDPSDFAVAELRDLEYRGPRTNPEERGDHRAGLDRFQTLQHATRPRVAFIHPLIERARAIIFCTDDIDRYRDTLIRK